MNTVQLECFLAVAEHLSFAKAAKEMDMSQPAITHQIQSLESELDVKLFRRTTRSVAITADGLAFLEDAKDIVARTLMAKKRFENPDHYELLELSIGCTSLSQLELFPDVLQKLRELYPNVHPRLFVNPSAQLLTRVEEGTIDIALAPQNAGTKKDALIFRELMKVPFVCVCKPDHPFANKNSVFMDEVRQHNLILYLPGSAAPEITQLQHNWAMLKKPSELYFCESAESAMILVRAGFSITILPNTLIEERCDLKKCLLADVKEISFGYYYKTLKGSKPLRDFIELLKQQEAPTK